jgi:hypothetical protein
VSAAYAKKVDIAELKVDKTFIERYEFLFRRYRSPFALGTSYSHAARESLGRFCVRTTNAARERRIGEAGA